MPDPRILDNLFSRHWGVPLYENTRHNSPSFYNPSDSLHPNSSQQNPSSQMPGEGTGLPCLPNIIIPSQAEAAWKSTFKAH